MSPCARLAELDALYRAGLLKPRIPLWKRPAHWVLKLVFGDTMSRWLINEKSGADVFCELVQKAMDDEPV